MEEEKFISAELSWETFFSNQRGARFYQLPREISDLLELNEGPLSSIVDRIPGDTRLKVSIKIESERTQEVSQNIKIEIDPDKIASLLNREEGETNAPPSSKS